MSSMFWTFWVIVLILVFPFESVVIEPVPPVVEVVNLEFDSFESWVRAPGGSDFDVFCKKKKDSIVESARQRG